MLVAEWTREASRMGGTESEVPVTPSPGAGVQPLPSSRAPELPVLLVDPRLPFTTASLRLGLEKLLGM